MTRRISGAFLLLGALVVAAPGEAEIVKLTIVHTNDIHGGINPSDATFMNRDFPPRLGGCVCGTAATAAAVGGRGRVTRAVAR